MAKTAMYLAEAERLYVAQGLSLDAVLGILEGKVSRKTLYNWKVEGDWDNKRKKHEEFEIEIADGVRNLVRKTMTEAIANPSRMTLLAFKQAYSIAKMTDEPFLNFMEGNKKPDQAEDSISQKKQQLATLFEEIFGVKPNL